MRRVVLLVIPLVMLVLAASAQGAAPTPCADDPAARCGHVDVPVDRTQAGGPTLAVAFKVFPHTDETQPALEPILADGGGPGFSVINGTGDFWRQFFGSLLERRDLVLVDQRGVGQSEAIDCEPLQSDSSDLYGSVAACARQLGAKADRFSTADVVEDIDDVRAAVGAETFDFYGGSYSGVDIQAYAVRHPDRLRAVVLDSPVPTTGFDPWFTDGA